LQLVHLGVYRRQGPPCSELLLKFSLVQPLLRMEDAPDTLERLSQTERTLLANVRQMEQFQSGFYVKIVSGRSAGEGPSRSGIVGASGLGIIAGTLSGRTGAPCGQTDFSGFSRNKSVSRKSGIQCRPVAGSFDPPPRPSMRAALAAASQVYQALQALFNAQSNLLSARAVDQTRVDTYKVELGLPPSAQLVIKDPL